MKNTDYIVAQIEMSPDKLIFKFDGQTISEAQYGNRPFHFTLYLAKQAGYTHYELLHNNVQVSKQNTLAYVKL